MAPASSSTSIPAAGISRPTAPVPESKGDSSQLDAASAAAVAAISRTVTAYVNSDVFDVRPGLIVAIQNLKPQQLTAVLEAEGKKWFLTLLLSKFPSGSRDLFNLVSVLAGSGQFAGDILKVFGGVVRQLCQPEKEAANLMRFVAMVTKSTAISLLDKEMIIWGTHAGDPTVPLAGHWVSAAEHENFCAQAAMLSGIVLGAEGDRTMALRLLPPRVESHVHALKIELDELPRGAEAQELFLSHIRKHLQHVTTS